MGNNNEHSPTIRETSRFSQSIIFLIDIDVKKVDFKEFTGIY